jgi:outer membrane receptor for monomeric catechols
MENCQWQWEELVKAVEKIVTTPEEAPWVASALVYEKGFSVGYEARRVDEEGNREQKFVPMPEDDTWLDGYWVIEALNKLSTGETNDEEALEPFEKVAEALKNFP